MHSKPKAQFDWATIVRRDGPRLFRYFRTRFDHHRAADLVQEVLLRLVRKEREGFQIEASSLTAYAFGVAHYVAKEAYKQRQRLQEDFVSDAEGYDSLQENLALSPNLGGISADEDLIQTREAALLRHAIRNLTLPSQEILSLLVDRDLSLKDIAEIMEIPLNTVKSHIHRSKEKLKVELSMLRETATHKGGANERSR